MSEPHSARSDRERAWGYFMCRGGMVGGMPLGVVSYQLGGWSYVGIAMGLATAIAVGGLSVEVWREVRRESR